MVNVYDTLVLARNNVIAKTQAIQKCILLL